MIGRTLVTRLESSGWLKANAGDVAAQFGVTVQQLEGVIGNYQSAYTSGVAQVLLIGAAVVAVGTVLAWFTFQKRAKARS